MQTTSASLLEQLRHTSAQEAWFRFVQLYTPLLYSWVNRTGLPRQEADDLVQEVFAALVPLLPKFEYDGGKSFRGWLRTVAINKLREKKRVRVLPLDHLGEQALAEVEAPDPVEQFWENEFRHQLVQQALQLMREHFQEQTWLACWDMVVEGQSAIEVAAKHGMTVAAVQGAKFRVLKRLQQELRGMMD